MHSTTSTTNNYISISIRNIDFEVECIEMEDADRILNIIGQVDKLATYTSKGNSHWDDPNAGLTYKFHYSYQEETQLRLHRRAIFHLKLAYPDTVFDRFGY